MALLDRYRVLLLASLALLLAIIFLPPGPKALLGLAGGQSISSQLDEGSQISTLSRLYLEGRPSSAARGTVRDFVGWQECLYVSYATLDGDYFLDVWNLSNPRSPNFLSEHYFGNSNDDRASNIPIAHLKSPRDLAVIDSHLILWSLFQGEVYPLQSDCSLGSKSTFNFGNGVSDVQSRLQYGGFYASALTRVNNREAYHLINLQNPTTPFTFGGGALNAPLKGSYDGLPATLELSQDKSEVSVTLFQQHRRKHLGTFWSEAASAIFNPQNRNLSLEQIISAQLDEAFLRAQQREALDILLGLAPWSQNSGLGGIFAEEPLVTESNHTDMGKISKKPKKKKGSKKKKKPTKKKKKSKKKQKKSNSSPPTSSDQDNNQPAPGSDEEQDTTSPKFPSLSELILKNYDIDVPVVDIFEQLNISETDSVELALQKSIAASFPAEFDQQVSARIMPQLINRFSSQILAAPNLSVSALQAQVKGIFDTKLSSAGLANYLVDHLFAPLIGNPAYMRLTLEALLDRVTDNPIAETIDSVLDIFNTVLPGRNTLKLLGFNTPNCFQIPNSSRDFLDIALIDSGPRLTPSNPAFYELLKMAEFYFGNTDFSQFESDLNTQIAEFHQLLSNEVVNQLIAFKDLGADGNLPVSSFLIDYGTQFSLKEVTAKLIAKSIISDLKNSGLAIEPTLPIEQFLSNHGLELDSGLFFGAKGATISDLIDLLNRYELGQMKLDDLFDEVALAPLTNIRSALALPLEDLIDQVFSIRSLNTTLNEAIETFVIGRMNPRISGDVVENIIGTIIDHMGNGIALPGVLGTANLAAQGDCVSQWRLAIDIASATAATLQLAPVAAALETASNSLQQALDLTAQYALRAMILEFVEEIFNSNNSNYPSWYTAMEKTSSSINIEELSGRSARLVNTFLSRNKVIAVFHEMGSLGVLPGEDREVTLLTFDPRSPALSKQVISLGEWRSITAVQSFGDYLIVVGNKFLTNSDSPLTVSLTDLSQDEAHSRFLFGDDALPFTATESVKVLRNGETFGLISAGGGIVLFH